MRFREHYFILVSFQEAMETNVSPSKQQRNRHRGHNRKQKQFGSLFGGA
jgi:hypothetical protein